MEILTGAFYGLLIGLALGLTGGGGSIITLPILVYLIGESVHEAIGTSLAVVAGIALQGLYGQRRHLDWKTGLLLGAVGIVGSVPGALLAQRVPGHTLLLLFAIVMIVAAIAMLIWRRPLLKSDEARPSLTLIVASGVGLGFLTGFLGVGGGFLIVPTLILALGFPMQRAIPTSLLVIALNAIVSLGTRAAGASIHWALVLEFLVGGLAGNTIGLFAARALDQRRLKMIFAVFVICVALFTGGSAIGVIPVSFH